MISFPNSKINIGLNIVSKRDDGYHNIETVFYPIPYKDILEILPSQKLEVINLGKKIDCKIEDNLCYKAYQILNSEFNLPPVKIILYKNVVFGSGLGSGSSDAAHTLISLNKLFDLNLDEEQLQFYASKLGTDCAFFIKNKAVFAQGLGNVFSEISLDLSGKHLMLCLPDVHVSTALAYKNCKPNMPSQSLKSLISLPLEQWKNNIKNDFEENLFVQFPNLQKIKHELYQKGAIYAQMSGSGSAIFGIFDSLPNLNFKNCDEIKTFIL